MPVPGPLPFVKGHGTENDFVLLPDPAGALQLPAGLVRRLCDRRAGIGADGVLRVVRTAAVAEVAHLAGAAEWFMDYRNADGSLAEMCGNGIRVYARYLVARGLAEPGELALATRNGVRRVWVERDGDVTVDMGPATVAAEPVAVEVGGRVRPAYAVELGNPHAVVLLAEPIAGVDFAAPVRLPTATFPAGANVELVNVVRPGLLRMRVLERGVGETRSCGTGACAAAAAAGADRDWAVAVPGGAVEVSWQDGSARLRGPATLVASGTVEPAWLAGISG